MRDPRILRLLLTAAVVAACQPAERPPAPPPQQRTESPALGIALAAVPETLRVDVASADRLELVPADGGEGRVVFELGPAETGGINLVEAVKAHQADVAARPGGDYKGQRELGGPLGTMFYSRGRYDEGGRTLEETVIFSVHPWGDRVLRIVYRYPAGEDSPVRLQDHLFALLEHVEALPAPADAAAGEPATPGV